MLMNSSAHHSRVDEQGFVRGRDIYTPVRIDIHIYPRISPPMLARWSPVLSPEAQIAKNTRELTSKILLLLGPLANKIHDGHLTRLDTEGSYLCRRPPD